MGDMISAPTAIGPVEYIITIYSEALGLQFVQ